MIIQRNDVVQFTEAHKWCGCLGIVDEAKKLQGGGTRYMVGIPVPGKNGEPVGTAYIFAKDGEIERIGRAALVPKGGEDSDD